MNNLLDVSLCFADVTCLFSLMFLLLVDVILMQTVFCAIVFETHLLGLLSLVGDNMGKVNLYHVNGCMSIFHLHVFFICFSVNAFFLKALRIPAFHVALWSWCNFNSFIISFVGLSVCLLYVNLNASPVQF